jgi:hypothetical protein
MAENIAKGLKDAIRVDQAQLRDHFDATRALESGGEAQRAAAGGSGTDLRCITLRTLAGPRR